MHAKGKYHLGVNHQNEITKKREKRKMSAQLLIIPQKKEEGKGREVGMRRDGGSRKYEEDE